MKYVLCLVLFLPWFLYSQNGKRWEIGVNVGAYKANNHTSIRYDGADVEYSNYNLDVEYYLNLNPSHPNSVYERIKQSYGDLDFGLRGDSYPSNMRYDVALNLGGHVGYKKNETKVFFADVNFVNLRTTDAITFEVDDPSTPTSQADIEVERIVGEEARLSINLGYHAGMSEHPDASPYLEFGLNITSTRVEKNSLFVQGQEYVLTQYQRNPVGIYQNVDFGGVGFGAFLGGGFRYRFNEQFVFDFGATGMYTKINLGPEFNQEYKLQGMAYLRILWS